MVVGRRLKTVPDVNGATLVSVRAVDALSAWKAEQAGPTAKHSGPFGGMTVSV